MARTMLAAWIENGRATLRQLPVPRPRRGEALLRVEYAGLCNTDLELLAGYAGFRGVPGHEFVAVVAAGSPRWLGKRVVGEINIGCCRCKLCLQGAQSHCPRRRVLGIRNHPGALAEFVTLPEANLHAVPRRMPGTVAVFCEPLAAACEILRQVRILPGERVAVLGDGKLGLLCAQALAAAGARVTVVGRHPGRAPWLARRAIRWLDSGNAPARGFPLVVEATGSAAGLQQALALATPRGAVVLKSTLHAPVEADLSRLLVVPEVTLIGSRCGPFPHALRLLRSRAVDTGPLVAHTLPLARVTEAFALAAQPGALKVLLACSPPASSTAQ